MIRILHLLDHDADFQTHRMADALYNGLQSDFFMLTQTVGRYPHQMVAQARQLKRGDWDILHTWGTRAILTAALAGIRKLVHTPLPQSRSPVPPWLRWIVHGRDVHFARGIAMPVSLANCQRDRATRQKYGFSPEDIVVLAPGQSTRAAGHRLALWTMAILHEMDRGGSCLHGAVGR